MCLSNLEEKGLKTACWKMVENYRNIGHIKKKLCGERGNAGTQQFLLFTTNVFLPSQSQPF